MTLPVLLRKVCAQALAVHVASASPSSAAGLAVGVAGALAAEWLEAKKATLVPADAALREKVAELEQRVQSLHVAAGLGG